MSPGSFLGLLDISMAFIRDDWTQMQQEQSRRLAKTDCPSVYPRPTESEFPQAVLGQGAKGRYEWEMKLREEVDWNVQLKPSWVEGGCIGQQLGKCGISHLTLKISQTWGGQGKPSWIWDHLRTLSDQQCDLKAALIAEEGRRDIIQPYPLWPLEHSLTGTEDTLEGGQGSKTSMVKRLHPKRSRCLARKLRRNQASTLNT